MTVERHSADYVRETGAMREHKVRGKPAAGVECPECLEITDERGGCACAEATYWAGPDWEWVADRLAEALVKLEEETGQWNRWSEAALAVYRKTHSDGSES